MEALFFKIFVWTCFVGLVLCTYLYGKNEEKMDAKVFLIRKIWYLLYMFGALVYWSLHPASILATSLPNGKKVDYLFAEADGVFVRGLKKKQNMEVHHAILYEGWGTNGK